MAKKVRIANTRPFLKPSKDPSTKKKRYVAKTTHRKGVGGRPRAVVPWRLVSRLAKIHCTPQEIATVIKIPWQTLVHQPKFRDVYERGWNRGNRSLRRKQYELAMNGDGRMLIWLGKQNLSQRDQVSQELSGPNGSPIKSELQVRGADIKKLSTKELKRLLNLRRKMGMEAIEDDAIDTTAEVVHENRPILVSAHRDEEEDD